MRKTAAATSSWWRRCDLRVALVKLGQHLHQELVAAAVFRMERRRVAVIRLKRYDEKRQALMRAALEQLKGLKDLSGDLYGIAPPDNITAAPGNPDRAQCAPQSGFTPRLRQRRQICRWSPG
jgi:hypothetical protein